MKVFAVHLPCRVLVVVRAPNFGHARRVAYRRVDDLSDEWFAKSRRFKAGNRQKSSTLNNKRLFQRK